MVLEASVWGLESRLSDLATGPLPGGVAAAAVAAAMGTALVAKAARLTQKRQAYGASDGVLLQAVRNQAQAQQNLLMRLAVEDERVYRAVLARTETGGPELDEARQAAAEIPIQLAEACQAILSHLSQVNDICWPTVRTELQTGAWLLEVGVRAGLLAADTNLRAWPDSAHLLPLQGRIDRVAQSSAGGTEDD